MTNVLTKETTRTKRSSVSHEIYKVAFGILVATALVVGVVAFASLGVGLAKVVIGITLGA